MKPTVPLSATREGLILLLFGLIGVVLFAVLFPRVQPSARLGIRVDRDEAQAIAEAHLAESGADLSAYTQRNTSLRNNEALGAFFNAFQASPEERARIEQHRPAVYWAVVFIDPATEDRYQLNVNVEGEVFACERKPPDDLPGGRLPQEEAESIARTYLSDELQVDMARYRLVDAQSVEREGRTDHTFTWQHDDPALGDVHLRLSATLQGASVDSWTRRVELPREYQLTFDRRETKRAYFIIPRVLLIIVICLIALIIFVLRFRAREIGIRNGVVVAIVVAALFTAFGLNTFPYTRHANLNTVGSGLATVVTVLNLGLQALFVGLGVFIVWVSGESLARETWPEKLRAFDGLFARRYFFPDLGRGILRGFSLGLGQLGLWFLLVWLLLHDPNRWPIVTGTDAQAFSAFLPIGLSVFSGASGALLTTAFAFLFTLTLLKQRLKRTLPAVVITMMIFGVSIAETTVTYDYGLTALVGIAVSLFSYLFFLRYDLTTVFIGEVVFLTIPSATMFAAQSSLYFQIAGGVALGVLGLLFVYGYVARTWGVPLDEKAIEPRYVQYITERERLKMELDIARRAQLRMLPREIPRARGLDIAAFSEPAREVGGDYFDFFTLSDDCLGIAVGDVSGKGMPAALYMTMLKGFLQSRADAETTPKAVLSHVNRKFFQSAERNVFVTLLYCVVDLSRSTLTFARAGHNPLLIYRPAEQGIYLLQPPGIGIGLEHGEVFDRVIEEETFRLQSGDTILLYTDGLTEARNQADEEFGEEQVIALMKSMVDGSAEELLHRIRTAYNGFIGRADAHDDLTCLVVKMT